MSKSREREISKYISLILRHKPEVIGITLDEHGWANVDELTSGIVKTHPIDRTLLEKIVAEDAKKRYSFNEDKTLIRANQGHSIPVDVELEQKIPPEILWHGTGRKFVESIDREGLRPMCKVTDYSKTKLDSAWCFIGKTEEENSLVCLTKDTPTNTTERDDGWKAFRVQGVLDFSLIGILSKISGILAENKIRIFAVSTYNTDYILVKEENYEKALKALSDAGYTVT